MTTKSNKEAQQWADAMEKRSRELATEVHRLRCALQDIKDATRPSKAFAGAEVSALTLIEKLASDAIAPHACPPGFDPEEWAIKGAHIMRGIASNQKLMKRP